MFKEHAFQKGTSTDFSVVSVEGVFLGWCFDTTRTVGYVKTDERVTRATTIAKLPTTDTPEDEEEVPEGWRRLKDPDERVYYENLKGERQWHYPVVMEAERTAEDKGKIERKTAIDKREPEESGSSRRGLATWTDHGIIRRRVEKRQEAEIQINNEERQNEESHVLQGRR